MKENSFPIVFVLILSIILGIILIANIETPKPKIKKCEKVIELIGVNSNWFSGNSQIFKLESGKIVNSYMPSDGVYCYTDEKE